MTGQRDNPKQEQKNREKRIPTSVMNPQGVERHFRPFEPYLPEDGNNFFGRDEEIKKINHRLQKHKLILILGKPGVGKTSLVNCGILANSSKQGFDIEAFDCTGCPGENFLEELKNKSQSDSPPIEKLVEKLLERTKYKNKEQTTVFVFDRFEELFFHTAPKERKKLAAGFNKLLSPGNLEDLNVKIIIILSEREYNGIKWTNLKKDIPAIFENPLNIGKMKKEAAIEVIEKTCEQVGIQIRDGLASLILSKISSEQSVEPLALQVYMERLVRNAAKKGEETIRISREDVENLGEMKNLLDFILEKEIQTPREMEKYKTLLKITILPGGSRRKTSKEEIEKFLQGFGWELNRDDVNAMITVLEGLNILLESEEGGEIELRYEQLAVLIYERLNRDERNFLETREELKQKYNEYKGQKKFLDSDFLKKLDSFGKFRNPMIIDSDMETFVRASRRKNEAKQTKGKRWVFAVSCALICILLLALLLYILIVKNRETVELKGQLEKANLMLAEIFKEKASVYAETKQWQLARFFLLQSLMNQFKSGTYFPMSIRFPEAYRHLVEKKVIGMDSKVYSVRISPDDKYLAAGLHNNKIVICSIPGGKKLATLAGHSDHVEAVCFSPGGEYLASGGWDHQVKLWNMEGNQEFKPLSGHQETVYAVEYSPDGQYLATASGDHTIKLRGTQFDNEVCTCEGHSAAVTSISFSSDSRFLVSGSFDNTVRLWNASNCAEIERFEGHNRPVTSVSFSPDGKYAASGSWDNTVILWKVGGDPWNRKKIAVLTGHGGYVESVVFSPDGTHLFSGSADDTIKVWTVPEGKEIDVLTGHTGNVYAIAVDANGSRLVSGSWDGTLRLWEVSSVDELAALIEMVKRNAQGGKIPAQDFFQRLEKLEISTGYRLEGNRPVRLIEGKK